MVLSMNLQAFALIPLALIRALSAVDDAEPSQVVQFLLLHALQKSRYLMHGSLF